MLVDLNQTAGRRTDTPLLTLIPLGAAAVFGLSGFLDGFYDVSAWGPLTLGLAALLVAAALAAPLELGKPGMVALGGLLLALFWTAVSASWAESLDSTWTEFGRLGLYAVVLTSCLIAIRSVDTARTVVRVIGLAVSAAGIYVVVRCLAGTGGELFASFRLIEPVGYFNGDAAYFCLGFWALFGLAERERRPAVQGGALMLATLLVEVAVLTQSRGAVAGLLVAAVVVLAAFPGRLRRAWLLALVAAMAAIALPSLLDVYADRLVAGAGDSPSDSVLRAAASAIVLTSVAGGLLWAVAMGLRPRVAAETAFRRLATGLLAVVVVAAGIGLLAGVGDPGDRARTAYDEFVSPAPELQDREQLTAGQRFTSAGGSRYHQWRLALQAFGDAPLMGVGAGNYATYWVQHKKTPDYVTQPHSLTLQALSELGLFGALGFLVFAGAVLWGAVKRASGGAGRSDLYLTIPCTGIFVMWLVQTNVDWLHKLPGITGIALVAAAVLLTRSRWAEPGPTGRFATARAAVAVLGALLIAASVGALWRADDYREQARTALGRDPSAAVRQANSSIALNPERIDTYVVKAAAYARLDDYRSARRVLRIAVAKEPQNYVPWALLGDLAVRRRSFTQAQRAYRQASTLNPSDRGLAKLAKKPQLATGGNGS